MTRHMDLHQLFREVEPIQGEAGVVVPQDGYLKRILESMSLLKTSPQPPTYCTASLSLCGKSTAFLTQNTTQTRCPRRPRAVHEAQGALDR